MNKDIIKKIILANQERIPGLEIHQRDIKTDPSANYIFTGQRRAGKTFYMYSIAQQLLKNKLTAEHILYINFEDERLMEMQANDLDTILESYREIYGHTPVLFFDEIQNIAGWQTFARRLADSGFRIYITGSNAAMLSGEMASKLGGRFLVKEINTLSFAEYLQFHRAKIKKNFGYSSQRFEIKKIFREYFEFGGFPETIRLIEKKEYLSTLFQKVFLGDIMARHNIRNVHALKLMIKKLAENATDETSYNRIRNIINSTGVNVGTATLIEYLACLEEAFMIKTLGNYTAKISERESRKKYYFKDHGLLNLFLTGGEALLLETMVFNRLYAMYGENVYYIRDQYEVDFYIPGQYLIQVCYSMKNYETRRRELGALAKALSVHKAKECLVITFDEEEFAESGSQSVRIVPVWKWLLEG